MSEQKVSDITIVDYDMGNLFSVKHMIAHVGMRAKITSSKDEILAADAVVLPGVGAFGDAMNTLKDLGLVDVLRDIAFSNKPLIGICLGMQLLMSESYEFGKHKGLNIIQGSVVRLNNPVNKNKILKVPHVCWNRIWKVNKNLTQSLKEEKKEDIWSKSPLSGLSDGEFMYFVHSFYVKPINSNIVLSVTRYGNIEFCSSFQYKNVFGCQFHPERSGPQGMIIYRNIKSFIENISKGEK
jgi:glutamine amidotransferase